MKTTLRLTVAAFGLASFNVFAATLYVSLESPNASPPYSTWATAATNIQHAVDVAEAGDTVLVTNGVYSVGGKTNQHGYVEGRVTITNAIRLESVNGPLVTTVDGGWSVRCVFLWGANAVLSGFTLTNGYCGGGGGVWSRPSGIVTNCTLTGNRVGGVLSRGGGAYGGTLYNCTLIGNSGASGGGASGSTLYNCLLTSNSGDYGGGASLTFATEP